MHDFDFIFFLELDEKFGFVKLGQCIVQQIYVTRKIRKMFLR